MPGPVENTVVAGRYTLERRISTAGYGSLWLARDEQTGQPCALRLADGSSNNLDVSELATRYRAEYDLVERIRCENVVDVMDYGDWRRMPYLVAEYLQCEDLASQLRREGQLSPELAYRILAHAARALARAHAVGIVHGDVTPENILVATTGGEIVAKLHNFGLTERSFESISGTVTRIGSFLRLPHYASPEQTAQASLDHRSDLWSLGVIGYECLTGKKPFDSNVYGDLVARILCAPHPELQVAGCQRPSELQAWWERACARDTAKRFQSAKEMCDALGNALGLAPIFMPEACPRPSVGLSADRSTQDAISAEPTQASARKQSFPSVPRRLTPLGIGVVNPNLISATSPPAWSTQEASSELRALEAQRLALSQYKLNIPGAPRLPNLPGTPVDTARVVPEVPGLTKSSEFGESEAPTVARQKAAPNFEFQDSEAPTAARRQAEPKAIDRANVGEKPVAHESDAPVESQDGSESKAWSAHPPLMAIIRAPDSQRGSTFAPSPWRRRWILIALGALIASVVVIVARTFVHAGSTVHSETSRADDSRSKLQTNWPTEQLPPPIVPASAGTRTLESVPAAGTEASFKEPTKVTDRRSVAHAESNRNAVSGSHPKLTASASAGTASEAAPVPKGTAAFDSDNPTGVAKPKSTKPQAPVTRDYGI